MKDSSVAVVITLVATLLFVGFGSFHPVLAADNVSESDPLTIVLDQFVVVPPVKEGEGEAFVALVDEHLTPQGTIIEYGFTVKNVSDDAIEDLVLGLDVPIGTTYMESSEVYDRTAALLQFSIDGGESFRAAPVTYIEIQPDGTEVHKVATAEMYTDLRLVFLRAMSPGEEVYATYRVVVD